MASEKRPSIYSDRSNIGSADELDEYGVWVKSEPQVLSTVNSISQKSDDFEDEISNIEKNIADESVSSNGNAETGYDDFFENSSEADANSGITSPADENFEEENFEIPTVKSIESSIDNVQENYEAAFQNKEGDLSTQLLLKIANELSSIRSELSDLKKEFATVRSSAPEEKTDEQEHGGFFTEEEDETIALTGDELNNILNTADFTEEAGAGETEEDTEEALPETQGAEVEIESVEFGDAAVPETETPADTMPADDIGMDASLKDLEYDEADMPVKDAVSEEAVSEEAVSQETNSQEAVSQETSSQEKEAADDLIDIDAEGLGINLDPETLLNEQVSEEGISDNIDIGKSAVEDEPPDVDSIIDIDESKDSEELQKLRDEGAVHITFPPENSSYLEEESHDAPVDTESLDLSEAVIDEPELSTDGIDEPVTEPSIDELHDEFNIGSFDDFASDDEPKAEEAPQTADESLDTGFSEDEEAGISEQFADDNLNIDISDESSLATEPSLDSELTNDLDIDFSDEESPGTLEPSLDDELKVDGFSGDELNVDFSDEEKPAVSEQPPEDELPSAELPEDDFNVSLSTEDDAAVSEPSLTDDMPEDDFSIGLPAEEDAAVSEPSLTDELPEDDFSIGLSAEEDAAVSEPSLTDDMPEDDFSIGLPAEDDAAVSEPPSLNNELPNDDFDINYSTEEDTAISESSLDDELPEDDFSDLSVEEDTAVSQPPSLNDEMLNDDFDINYSTEEDSVVSKPSDDEIPEDNFDISEEDISAETDKALFDDSIEQVIPEVYEAEIEEAPVPFDDDLEEGFDETLDIPEAFKAADTPKAASAKDGKEVHQKGSVSGKDDIKIPSELKKELRNILTYMDQLLESLPEKKIEEFARSEYFDSYKKLFKELGLV